MPWFLTVTSAFAMTPPEESATVPVSVASSDWASSEVLDPAPIARLMQRSQATGAQGNQEQSVSIEIVDFAYSWNVSL